MNFVSLLPFSGSISAPAGETCPALKVRSSFDRRIVLAAILLAALAASQRSSAQIQVSPNTEGNTFGSACSLQEAIYATEFGQGVAIDSTDPDHTYYTGCSALLGDWTTIFLPGGTLSFTKSWDGDAHHPFGPTATPIIFKTITIQGNGTTLQWTGSGHSRLFAVGQASISPTNGVLTGGTYSGTGNLTLQNVYAKNFSVKGGDGIGGGGGGLGAGGVIYVGGESSGTPSLTVENSTFDNNGATGGNGGGGSGVPGGGGGLGGNGGAGNLPDSQDAFAGGGGGGARGDGGNGGGAGGGGGGTVFSGGVSSDGSTGGAGGYLCGGNGGDLGNDGHVGQCPGGGGGGAASNATIIPGATYNGASGAYGGGGGGGNDGGGSGGFGGGGGAVGGCASLGQCAGSGGFGGGGGDPDGGGGHFGGKGGQGTLGGGGGGGALGGAIFNDSGTVTVRNSTFYNNAVLRGLGGGGSQGNGGDSGGAIFSRDGSLTVENATITGGAASGAGGGIVVYADGATAIFVLENSIVANNGGQDCITGGTGTVTTGGKNNLIVNNSGCPQATVTSDPTLDSLKLNKPGNTPTMALLSGSPAIGAGDSGTSLTTDQRGVTRKATPDIGAYETVPQADLTLTKTVSSSTAKAGDTVTYTLTLANLGPDTANSVTVTDNFPAELTYISCTASGGGSCSSQGATYTTLAASSPQTITISGILKSGLTRGMVVTNDARVQASSPDDPDTTNNSGSASVTVLVPDFSVSAVSPITIVVGGSGTSSLTIGSIDTFSSAVSLTGTGPSGFQESFSPNPVTPPSNGSANSTMTVSLGPSVTAGAYTVNVTGTSSPLTHTVSVTVNVQATISGTISVIGTDQALGCIDNSGVGGALQNKLQAALADINAGRIQDAINTLQASLNQLQAQRGKHIKTSCTDGSGNTFDPDAVLIADVKTLLASLGVNVADPIVGNVLNTSGAGLSGVTVKILNSKNSTVATAATDVTGFYYFPATGGLTPGASYTAKVTVPKSYKNSTPSSQSFTWKAVGVVLNNFALN